MDKNEILRRLRNIIETKTIECPEDMPAVEEALKKYKSAITKEDIAKVVEILAALFSIGSFFKK